MNANNKDFTDTTLNVSKDENVATSIHSIQTSIDLDNTSKRDRHVDKKRTTNNREYNNRNIHSNERGSYNSNNMIPRNISK